LDFARVGVLRSIAAPLSAAGVSIFAISTYDTDYVLVRAAQLDRAAAALREVGHRIEGPAA
ncbi:MAG: ACT domain-containing protein, partial [Chloroflexales bacterium]|nr:ACT domain-containing protein [Chloroflexales bacterium]